MTSQLVYFTKTQGIVEWQVPSGVNAITVEIWSPGGEGYNGYGGYGGDYLRISNIPVYINQLCYINIPDDYTSTTFSVANLTYGLYNPYIGQYRYQKKQNSNYIGQYSPNIFYSQGTAGTASNGIIGGSGGTSGGISYLTPSDPLISSNSGLGGTGTNSRIKGTRGYFPGGGGGSNLYSDNLSYTNVPGGGYIRISYDQNNVGSSILNLKVSQFLITNQPNISFLFGYQTLSLINCTTNQPAINFNLLYFENAKIKANTNPVTNCTFTVVGQLVSSIQANTNSTTPTIYVSSKDPISILTSTPVISNSSTPVGIGVYNPSYISVSTSKPNASLTLKSP